MGYIQYSSKNTNNYNPQELHIHFQEDKLVQKIPTITILKNRYINACQQYQVQKIPTITILKNCTGKRRHVWQVQKIPTITILKNKARSELIALVFKKYQQLQSSRINKH